MGLVGGIDIACNDCHANERARLAVVDLSPEQARALRRLPFAVSPQQRFLRTANGTPLWHVELRGEQALLHPKAGGPALPVPQAGPGHVPEAEHHTDLDCAACHATWAPQCYGCHVSYEPDQWQWDHADGRLTPGLWRERRWGIRNDLPALGRGADGKIGPVVPGMIMTLEHPELAEPLFVRRFAALAPHTTGRSRRCDDCHANARALGLGSGAFKESAKGPVFHPHQPALRDGLAADAWTNLEAYRRPDRPNADPRPFTDAELQRLLRPQADDSRP